MKILIWGDSPSVLYLASKFVEVEASVTIWGKLDPLKIYQNIKDNQDNWKDILMSLRQKIIYKSDEIKSIHKTYLLKDEQLETGKIDTFKVIVTKDEIDYFDEYDFIIDLRGVDLNEQDQKIYVQNFNRLKSFEESKSLTQEKLILFENEDDLIDVLESFKDDSKIYLLPMRKNIEENLVVKEILDRYENEFDKQVENFKKLGKGNEPERKIELLTDYSLISIDRFDDSQDKLFAYLEKPKFRVKARVPQKVIGFQSLMDLRRGSKLIDSKIQLYSNLEARGYYKPSVDDSFEKLENTYNTIFKDMLTYFSRA